jgi:putative flavoprotein involved in K+ transport
VNTALDTIRTGPGGPTRIGTVVIGGAQAGLVMGYYLQRRNADFVILEAQLRVGDGWRQRYDSLKLFSIPRYASLPGLRIPVRDFPTRDEFADYLEQYAAHFELPVRTGVRVVRVCRHADGALLVQTTDGSYLADSVVVATGSHQRAFTPDFAAEIDPSVVQLHSMDYRNPGQLPAGGVLVVGAANSGTDVALDSAAAGHPTWLAGRHPGQVPVDIDSRRARPLIPVVMFVFKHVLTLRTPMGRKARPQVLGHGANLVRNKLADLDAAGIVRIGRIAGVHDGQPITQDGPVPDIATVVWCTGSHPDYRFLDLPSLDTEQRPEERRGVSPEAGLYFLGLEFQFALASGTIQGLDRDARYLVRRMRKAGRLRRTARELVAASA